MASRDQASAEDASAIWGTIAASPQKIADSWRVAEMAEILSQPSATLCMMIRGGRHDVQAYPAIVAVLTYDMAVLRPVKPVKPSLAP